MFLRLCSRVGQAAGRALVDDAAAATSGVGAYVDQMVGRADYLLVVLYDDHRVADVAQAAEHTDQAVGVARMEPDARLVENVERPYEAAPELCGQIDALALAA